MSVVSKDSQNLLSKTTHIYQTVPKANMSDALVKGRSPPPPPLVALLSSSPDGFTRRHFMISGAR